MDNQANLLRLIEIRRLLPDYLFARTATATIV